jgi:hypothetical protein
VVLINGYDGDRERVMQNARYIQDLLRRHAQSDGGQAVLFHG